MIIQLSSIKIPPTQLSFLKCQVLCIVFAELYYRVVRTMRMENLRHMYCFVVSNLLLLVFLNGSGVSSWIHVYVPVLLTFWATCVNGLANPWVVVGGLFAHLGWSHWKQMQLQYLAYNIDHTVVLMLMSTKLSAFAFDMWDKQRNPSDERLREVKRPSFLKFLGYSFLFPGFFSGPAILYPQYEKFISNDQVDAHHQRRHRWALEQTAKAIGFGVAYGVMESMFDHKHLLTTRFASLPLIHKLLFLHIANMTCRFKYYTAWLMAEASLVTMGFEIGSVQIVRPMKIELATDPREVLLNWNISTDRWLHRYFYSRVVKQFGVTVASIFVKIVSAVWHGFYPGYYIMFISYGLVMATSRSIYRNLTWPFRQSTKPMVTFLPVWLVLDFITPPFVLLTWSDSAQYYNSMYWWAHCVCVSLLILLRVNVKPKKA